MLRKVNVAGCDTQLLYERGKFQTTCHDLTEAFGARVIGATVFETAAGYTRGPYHFHDGVEEWMYVVSGEPVLRDPSGERAVGPGSVVAFQAGPDGAHTFDGPGRVVMFSVGARGWGEAFTSVYLDADKIGGKPGVRFLRAAALESWTEPAAVPVSPAPAGPSPQVDLLSLPADSSNLTESLHTQTWSPFLYELRPGETTGPYHYDWCREHWALVVSGMPTLRHPGGQDVMTPGDIVCFPEGEVGAHQFLNHADEPARLLVCSAPVTGPSAAVYPDDNTYVLRVPGQTGYRFRLGDQLPDYWDGEPGAGSP
ncbi:MAG: cupin domain-containing protein [Solirubrobacteraceae bacterium]